MPSYIVVTGAHDTGKTTSIKRAYLELGGKNTDDGDIVEILTYTNKKEQKVGFASAGDIPDIIDNNLKKLKKCDIIVGACRTSGKTTEYYLSLSRKNKVYWIGKPRDKNIARSNKATAEHIIELITDLDGC